MLIHTLKSMLIAIAHIDEALCPDWIRKMLQLRLSPVEITSDQAVKAAEIRRRLQLA